MIGRTRNEIIRDDDSVERDREYTLAFVEFDDEGWFYNSSQMEELRKYLEEEDRKGSRFLLTVYVHGWRHNAGDKDQNVCKFRQILQRLSRDENVRHGKDRRGVVGIYVGWRGRSLRGPLPWEVLSFYGRKKAALYVSLGAVRELFAWLKHFQTQSNRDLGKAQSRTRLLFIGHSFGGLILFSAISQYLIESALNKDELVRPFGDLVVLINPAFEACRYYPVHCIIQHRKTFRAGQPPALVMVTADTDTTTKRWFQLGRRLGLARWRARVPDQATTVLRTVGHVPFMQTHRLTAKRDHGNTLESQENSSRTEVPTEAECADIIGDDDKLYREFIYNDKLRTPDGHLKPGWERLFNGGAVLKHMTCDPENPYWGHLGVERRHLQA